MLVTRDIEMYKGPVNAADPNLPGNIIIVIIVVIIIII